jgi:hypothetical protein
MSAPARLPRHTPNLLLVLACRPKHLQDQHVNGTDLSAMNLAYFPMTAGVAGALFIAITIALNDRPSVIDRPDVLTLIALLCPVMVVGLDILAFVSPADAEAHQGILRAIIGILLLLAMAGLGGVLFTLPRRTHQS